MSLENLPKALQEVYDKKPDWVDREIVKTEASALYREITSAGAQSAIEIGVASGFSSAVILSALQENGDNAVLHAFDLAKQCYFDKTKLTGQAVTEIHGKVKNYNLTAGITSADVPASTPVVDFVFIDAGHRHPWPALDLLSLHRFVKPGTVIALHDVNWPLQSKGAYRQNGPRDLIRMWVGEKRIYKEAPNIGFVVVGNDYDVFESICRALLTDWDTEIDAQTLDKFVTMTGRFGASAKARLQSIFDEKRNTAAKTQLVRV